ncbi:MAG: DNA adenine methylase [Alphaproteobacteria bacterium]|nr:DNA adenine methylase [Alphaproteobacteria bacterium]
MKWEASTHSANATDEYLFHQLIPYIGNKRKLLRLIHEAINASGIRPETHTFVDLFAGTGVVSRLARQLGYAVVANDWEPYSEIINRCYLGLTKPPTFFNDQTYAEVLAQLNTLPPREDWITRHLCPNNDECYDTTKDRMFYTRKNGMRIDAIRHQIDLWQQEGRIDASQQAALLAPLLYQCCYNSNTSGVFKGFHNGWGGRTNTALYRIKGELSLRPAQFLDNGQPSFVLRDDAHSVVRNLPQHISGSAFLYLDPPYNQHPYGANYHVLNSVALWDKPELPAKISKRGDKAAIRKDWRTERRSAYNYRDEASDAYQNLLQAIPESSWTATSYSTDGMIPLRTLLQANCNAGDTQLFTRAYKRYRVSSQRYSVKPMNIEFVVLTKIGTKPRLSVDELASTILRQEAEILSDY